MKAVVLPVFVITLCSTIVFADVSEEVQGDRPERQIYYSQIAGAWGLMLGLFSHCLFLPVDHENRRLKTVSEARRLATFILVPMISGSAMYIIGYCTDVTDGRITSPQSATVRNISFFVKVLFFGRRFYYSGKNNNKAISDG